MSLAENAAKLAGRNGDGPQVGTSPEASPPPAPAADAPMMSDRPAEQLPEIDEPGVDEPVADVPAVVAWARVMREVRAIDKGDKFQGGRAGTFDFRGIDRVVYHFGPALRRHGVVVMPHKVEPTYRDITTSGGATMRQCDITVTWRIYGPRGDFIEAQTAGEGLDTGGRSTTKAQTIAERVLFLVGGVVPTEDADPESRNIERGEAPLRSVASYRDEVLNSRTSAARLRQIRTELRDQRRLTELTENETGEDEQIGALIDRIGKERAGGSR
ncbi:ERF family protein [Actinomadura sp. 21ATH]|uniref:ERF family protein n=1 Tax=Actinomadura sp. 21ATH TaxID=1735444 RepID=UPI0035C1E0CC